MTPAKHTPGPWEKKFNSLRVQIVAEPKIAICYTDTFGTSGQEAEANARLIAAAPKLLEALKAAEELLAFHEGSAEPKREGGHPVIWVNGEDWQNLLDKTRAAIAKAEGGAR